MNLLDGARNVRSLGKSFQYAFRGVRYCIRNERNMRIHLTFTAYVLAFSPFFGLTRGEYAALLIVIGLVLATEAANTAVEAFVNLQTQHYDTLARIAKDVAAGAVFITALFALAVGLVLFLRPDKLLGILRMLLENPLAGLVFLLSVPAALLFIFCFPFRRRSRRPR